MSKDNRNVRAEFGILNLGGYMVGKISEDGTHSEIINPLFAHETYKIKTTFNRNIKYTQDGEEKITSSFGIFRYEDQTLGESDIYYQKKFRRNVLWDFGDGTKVEGNDVEHYYKKPGRYKITCTFFDINRLGWRNTFSLIVQVKELIPTSIRFSENENNFKSKIKCSKIEKIAKIEALLSKDTNDLKLRCERVFEEGEENKENSYFKIKDEPFYHFKPYYTFFKNEKIYRLNSEEIHTSYLNPIKKYDVEYYDLYAKFQYDEITKSIIQKIYLYHPLRLFDDDHKFIKCINPNCNIINGVEYINVDVFHATSKDELIGTSFVGKRGFVDIYYKNDVLSTREGGDFIQDNTFSFFYDLEENNIINDIRNSKNYINNNPLGMSISIVPNSLNDVKVSLSLNGFLRDIDGDANYHIDEYFINSFVKDYSLDGYFVPYILYNSDETVLEEIDLSVSDGEIVDFKTDESSYYIPKDITIENIDVIYNSDVKHGFQSKIEPISDWDNGTFVKYNFISRDYIDHNYIITLMGISNRNDYLNESKKTEINLKRYNITDINNLIIPSQKMTKVDVKRLVDVYMSHPMFDEAYNLKNVLYSLLGNDNFLSYIMTKSDNFLDDRANLKTCYLSNLLSTLKMMGEEITDYETTEFEGINEMRDFVRILSMNHNDLVGHLLSKPVDIHVTNNSIGKNVGNAVSIDDRLIVSTIAMEDFDPRGLIMGYKKSSDNYKKYHPFTSIYGTNLIVQDRYTMATRVVSFTTIPSFENIYKKDESGHFYISLRDYDESWGWNLLLSERFKIARKELNSSKTISASRRKRLEDMCADVIDGYYAFYFLNPKTDKYRVGNFLEESHITNQIEDLDRWEENWGYVNDVLMKIIIENAGLRRDIPVLEQKEDIEIEKVKSFSFKKYIDINEDDVRVTLSHGGHDEHMLYIQRGANMEGFTLLLNDEANVFNLYLNDLVIKHGGDDSYQKIIKFDGNSNKLDFRFDVKDDSFEIIEESIDLFDEEGNYLFSSYLNIEIYGTVNKEDDEKQANLLEVKIDMKLDIPL